MAHCIGKTGYALLLALSLIGTAHAQRYTYFGPVNGILKGSASTWQTSAAAWSDVQALLTGTCDSSHVVTGAGGCITPAAGTLTGITFTVPSGLSISGSPCTTGACSFAITTTLSGLLKGTGSGFTAAAATDVTSLLNPTAHGVLFGEGAAAFTSLTMAADTVLQGTGTGSDPQAAALVDCGDTSHALSYSTSTHLFGCQALSTGGTPGGLTTQVQFNNAGVFGGASNVTYATASGDLTIATPTSGTPFTVNGGNGNTTPISIFASTNSTDVEARTSTSGDFAQMRVIDSASVGGGFCISNSANVCEAAISAGALDLFAGSGNINLQPSGILTYKNHQVYVSGRWTSSAGGCALASGSGWSASGGPGGGACTVPFAVAFSSIPTCTVTPESGSTNITSFINSISTTQVTIEAVNLSGVGQNDTMDVTCVGTL